MSRSSISGKEVASSMLGMGFSMTEKGGVDKRLLQVYCGVGVLAYLVTFFTDLNSSYRELAWVDAVMCLLCVGFLYLVKRGLLRFTVFLFTLCCLSGVFIYGLYYGRESGNYLFYVVLLMAQIYVYLRDFKPEFFFLFALTAFLFYLEVFEVGNAIPTVATVQEAEQNWVFNVVLATSVIVLITLSMVLLARNAMDGLRQELHERKVMLAELNHRVRNNMNVVLSLVNLQIRSAESEEARAALEQMRSRIYAMASVHNHSYGSVDLTCIPLDRYLEDLFRNQGVDLSHVHVTNTDHIELNASQAIPLGIMVNELIYHHLTTVEPRENADYRIALASHGHDSIRFILDSEHRLERTMVLEKVAADVVDGLRAQLDGEMILECEDRFRFEITFPREVTTPSI